jgi:hypothetical protein
MSSNKSTESSTTSSSLLFLLDGLLSQDDQRIHDALVQMNQLVHDESRHTNNSMYLLPKLPLDHRFNTPDGEIIMTSTKTHFPTLPKSTIIYSTYKMASVMTTMAPTISWKFSKRRRVTTRETTVGKLDENRNVSSSMTMLAVAEFEEEEIILDICSVLHIALDVCPQLAHARSLHDGSNPLHFAASLGYVPIASIILHRVSRFLTKSEHIRIFLLLKVPEFKILFKGI